MKLPTSPMCQWNLVRLSVDDEKCVPSVVVSSAPWPSSCAYDTRRHESPQFGFSVAKQELMLWHLLLGPVVGGQVYRVLPISKEESKEKRKFSVTRKQEQFWSNAEESARAKFTRAHVVKQFWTYVVEDNFDLDSAIQTDVVSSHMPLR